VLLIVAYCIDFLLLVFLIFEITVKFRATNTMSNLLITDIPVLTDIAIEQQGIIVGGATTDSGTISLPNYILSNPIIKTVFSSLNLNPVDVTNYLNSQGLDITLPTMG